MDINPLWHIRSLLTANTYIVSISTLVNEAFYSIKHKHKRIFRSTYAHIIDDFLDIWSYKRRVFAAPRNKYRIRSRPQPTNVRVSNFFSRCQVTRTNVSTLTRSFIMTSHRLLRLNVSGAVGQQFVSVTKARKPSSFAEVHDDPLMRTSASPVKAE